MKQFYIVFFLLCCSFFVLRAQSINDDCGTAIDITDQFVHLDTFIDCYMANGGFYSGIGYFLLDFEQATVGTLGNTSNYNFISDQCEGYIDTTTASFPDIWFKIASRDTSGIDGILYSFSTIYDTLQVAFYYGKCNSLFQLQAFTLLPPNYDEDYFQRFSFTWGSTRTFSDSIYMQFRSPRRWESYVCINDWFHVTNYKSYAYDRPAIDANLSNSSKTIKSLEKVASFFPNPSTGFLQLKVDKSVPLSQLEVRFYSLVRQQIATFKGQTEFDLSGFGSGVYVAEVRVTGKIFGRKKVVLQR